MRVVALCAAVLIGLAAAASPVDIPCVHWEAITSYQNTPNPNSLFRAAYTWVIGNEFGQCLVKGDIFPCFSSETSTWGHHDYQAQDIPADYCRTYVNDSVYMSNNLFVPKKGPQWHTWKWQLAQTGGKVPDNAIRFGESVMARSTQNPAGMCCGKGFTGWAVGKKDGTFGAVHFTIQNTPVTTNSFEVAICKAYHPTPEPTTAAPPTPEPLTPEPPTPMPPPPTTEAPPTLPPNNKPYIRFGNAIPEDHAVTVTISQGSVSYTWDNYNFAKFSHWVEVFADGFGNITVYESVGGTRGQKLLEREIPLTPGPLVVVTRGYWPPTQYTSVETIAASYVPPAGSTDSGVRLFNLSPDTESMGLKRDDTTVVDHVKYSIGSVWAPVPVDSATFSVFNDKGNTVLATQSTTPPEPPFVFTIFAIGLNNATAGSTYSVQAVPLIDAPEF